MVALPRILWALLATSLVACVTAPSPVGGERAVGSAPAGERPVDAPLLSLSPASLGGELHLAQRVTVLRGEDRWTFDALLEADAEVVQLAAFVMGQTVLRLKWDGRTLEEEHSARAPDAVTPSRILSDVQLAFWPREAVSAALPAHFTLDEAPLARVVTRDGEPFATLRFTGTPPAWRQVELTHLAYGYRLVIESKEAP
jgi:hypothetical protein